MTDFNGIEEQLMAVGKDAPGCVVSGIEEREFGAVNSVVLHAHRSGCLGDDGKPRGTVATSIADGFGGTADTARTSRHFVLPRCRKAPCAPSRAGRFRPSSSARAARRDPRPIPGSGRTPYAVEARRT